MRISPKLSLLFLAVISLAIAWYVSDHLNELYVLSRITTPYIILLAIMNVFSLAINGHVLKIIVYSFGVPLQLLEHFAISTISSFANIFTPFTGGAAFRAVYLKARYNLCFSHFASCFFGNYLITFSSNALIALICQGWLFLSLGYHSPFISATFAAIAAASIGAMFLHPNISPSIPFTWLREKVANVLAGWCIIRKSSGVLSRLLALSVLNTAVSSTIMYLEFAALQVNDTRGNPVTILQSIFLTTVSSLSLLINLTPAALGIRESLLMLTGQVIHILPSHMLSVVILDRVVSCSLLMCLFYPATRHLKVATRPETLEE